MGHYDSCRDGYCGKCGAGPGNKTCVGGAGKNCPHRSVKPAPKKVTEAMITASTKRLNKAKEKMLELDQAHRKLLFERRVYLINIWFAKVMHEN